MECGFRPHDRDRTAMDMGVSKMGYWAVMEGFWAATHTRGLHSYPVNRWSIKRPPNDPKLDRRSTGVIPRHPDKPRSIPRRFNTRSRRKVKGDVGEHRSAGLQNGQRGKCSEL